ncbi:hypothetical protein OKJ48_31965 [Streptomyces kunmingensis]|uniref:Uncharacterized protein n=1 Tax=Streptomyces kunmingensis TaxID=68225 RepID=A0ABU6CJK7_9ACTN|nr:hypothetical protein [Streptomyces kunmingensis]MEB3964812.1 hypothetical protein [Streptomyces kunmingensis]
MTPARAPWPPTPPRPPAYAAGEPDETGDLRALVARVFATVPDHHGARPSRATRTET